ncbi:hypothetical protein F5X99DRAFT_409859 [Biscogniauxia marginata]|nr:hypothetical protein F5X99DRAFT_409859 [Biscogniauxia marginata]
MSFHTLPACLLLWKGHRKLKQAWFVVSKACYIGIVIHTLSIELEARPPTESLENGQDANVSDGPGFDRLWNDVLNGKPTMEGYDQIFADLDVYYGLIV